MEVLDDPEVEESAISIAITTAKTTITVTTGTTTTTNMMIEPEAGMETTTQARMEATTEVGMEKIIMVIEIVRIQTTITSKAPPPMRTRSLTTTISTLPQRSPTGQTRSTRMTTRPPPQQQQRRASQKTQVTTLRSKRRTVKNLFLICETN